MSVSAAFAGADAASPFSATPDTRRDREVQSVFSEVLELAGRDGYASAERREDGRPIEESLQATWSDWFDSQRQPHGRYAQVEAPDQLQQTYGDILLRAHREQGYVAPKEFLAGLSAEELKTVQKVQALAAPIDVASLTEEGALNLLLPPAAQVDLNHDGITKAGAANGLRFPSSDTPPDVVQAWDAATAGMSFSERMLYELQMVLPITMENFILDESGAYVGQHEPGDPGYVNPMARDDYSYQDAVQNLLDALDFQKNEIPPEQYEQRTEFWRRFGAELESRSAP